MEETGVSISIPAEDNHTKSSWNQSLFAHPFIEDNRLVRVRLSFHVLGYWKSNAAFAISRCIAFIFLIVPICVWFIVFLVAVSSKCEEFLHLSMCSTLQKEEKTLYAIPHFLISLLMLYSFLWTSQFSHHDLCKTFHLSLQMLEQNLGQNLHLPLNFDVSKSAWKAIIPSPIRGPFQRMFSKTPSNDVCLETFTGDTKTVDSYSLKTFITQKTMKGLACVILLILVFVCLELMDTIIGCQEAPRDTIAVWTISVYLNNENSSVIQPRYCIPVKSFESYILYGYPFVFHITLSMLVWLVCHFRQFQVNIVANSLQPLVNGNVKSSTTLMDGKILAEPNSNECTDYENWHQGVSQVTTKANNIQRINKLISALLMHNETWLKVAHKIDRYLSWTLSLGFLIVLIYINLFVAHDMKDLITWLRQGLQVLKICVLLLSPWYFGALKGCCKITQAHTNVLVEAVRILQNEDMTKDERADWGLVVEILEFPRVNSFYSNWLASDVQKQQMKFLFYGTIVTIIWTWLNNYNDFIQKKETLQIQ